MMSPAQKRRPEAETAQHCSEQSRLRFLSDNDHRQRCELHWLMRVQTLSWTTTDTKDSQSCATTEALESVVLAMEIV